MLSCGLCDFVYMLVIFLWGEIEGRVNVNIRELVRFDVVVKVCYSLFRVVCKVVLVGIEEYYFVTLFFYIEKKVILIDIVSIFFICE